MTRTGEQAIAYTLQPHHFGEDECLMQVNLAFDVAPHDFTPGNGHDPWAIEMFDYAQHKHPTGNPTDVPRGVPACFRSKTPGRPGHIVIALGDGKCRTTDYGGVGRWNTANIADIARDWGMTFVGWVEDLGTVRVYTPPVTPPKEPVVPISTPHIDNAIAELSIAINARKPGPVRFALRTSRRAAIAARRLAKGA